MSQFLAKRGGTALISLVNAPVNGLSHNVRLELLQNLEKATAEKATAIVLVGAGKHFSAGADIKEFARGGHMNSPSLNDVINYLDSYPIPVVAGLHGSALGGGLETALACHWRIANNTALIGLPEVHLGILPGTVG
jgi:3-hydroxyacyl-CoA dehydrogenase